MSKRDDILSAALELFAERGFYGTPVPLIAERAGVGAGTIYRYFESKEILVNELFQQWKSQYRQILVADLPADMSIRQLLHEVWQRMVVFGRQNPTALTFLELHHHAPYLDQTSRRLCDDVAADFEALLGEAVRAQVIKDLPLDLLIRILQSIFMGMMSAYWAGKITLTPQIIAGVEEIAWEALRR